MKVVIDISEEEYDECKMQVDMIKQEGFLIESLNTALKIHVANGTPLPEGHGRLGDLDALAEFFRNTRKRLIARDYASGIEFHTRDNMLLNAEQFISLAPTIIEADGGDQE